MIVSCPSCQARFQYDENRFQGAPQKRFRCPKCASVFEVINPALEVTAATLHPMPTAAASVPPVLQAQVAYPAAASQPAVQVHPAQPQPIHPTPAPTPTPSQVLPPLPTESVLPTLPSVPNFNQGVETTLLDGPRGTTSNLNRNPTRNNLATAMPQGFRFSLAFLSGSLSGSVRPILSPITVIGREEGDVITGDPECSRRHCEITIQQDGSVWMRDLGSTNGTFVDGVQVFGSAQLGDRQEFTCGKSTFMILIRNEDLQMI